VTERMTAAEWRDQQPKPRRRPREIEHYEQVALLEWAWARLQVFPELEMLFAIPNGGHRKASVAGKLRAEGVKRGVPDICLPVARGGYHGLFIEMKAVDGRPTADQKNWIAMLNMQGYRATVCKGWEAARDEIVAYLAEKTGRFVHE
jgi:hypothetical protein